MRARGAADTLSSMAASPFARTSAVKAWAGSKSVDVPGGSPFARSAEHAALRAALDDGDRFGSDKPKLLKFRKGQGVKFTFEDKRWPEIKKGARGTIISCLDDKVARPNQKYDVLVNGKTFVLPETFMDEA